MKVTEGNFVYLRQCVTYWDEPYPMKSHHVYKVKSVVVRARVVEVKGQQFKGKLVGNLGFEKDGETFVFHTDQILADKKTKPDNLGVWVNN